MSSCRSRAQPLWAGSELCLHSGGTARTGASFARVIVQIVIKEPLQPLGCARLCREQGWPFSIGWGWHKDRAVIYRVRCPQGFAVGCHQATSKLCHTNVRHSSSIPVALSSQEIILKISFCLQSVVYEELLNIYIFNFL